MLSVTPLALLSETVAIALLAGVGIGAFAWALGENGYPSLLALLSVCTWHALHLVQWSPLLTAGLVLAPVSLLWIVKPTIGAALFAARPTWWAATVGAVAIVLSFVLQPDWLTQWQDALNSSNVAPGYHAGHFAIVQFVGGALVFAALLRWRRPEARLLVAMACVPQTLLPYEAVPLFMMARGWLESIVFLVLSYAMRFYAMHSGAHDFATVTPIYGQATTIAMYLPATVMVLRRPNEGVVPAWIESRIAAWPAWLRGHSLADA